jgi:flagellar hook protein FlgE
MLYDNALAGINAANHLLNTAGNNIANANTVGFKGFNDVFSSSRSSSMSGNSGSQNFAQGTVASTNSSSDIAINGNGFFPTINANNQISYTREGNFSLNSTGNLVNAKGLILTDTTGTPIVVNTNASMPGKKSTAITATAYLDPNKSVINGTLTPFSPTDSSSYSSTNSTVTYDGLGNATKLQVYYVNQGSNTYQVYTTSPQSATPVNVGSVSINPSSGLITSTSLASPASSGVSASGTVSSLVPASFSGIPISSDGTTVSLNLSDVSQLSNNTTKAMTADGSTFGAMTSYTINSDGTITSSFSNNTTQNSSQKIGLVTFVAPGGLQPTSTNSWLATSASGLAIAGSPSANGFGSIQSSALENSNVDMTTQLVNLLAAQRAYQANSQAVKAQDAVLQNIINLS